MEKCPSQPPSYFEVTGIRPLDIAGHHSYYDSPDSDDPPDPGDFLECKESPKYSDTQNAYVPLKLSNIPECSSYDKQKKAVFIDIDSIQVTYDFMNTACQSNILLIEMENQQQQQRLMQVNNMQQAHHVSVICLQHSGHGVILNYVHNTHTPHTTIPPSHYTSFVLCHMFNYNGSRSDEKMGKFLQATRLFFG